MGQTTAPASDLRATAGTHCLPHSRPALSILEAPSVAMLAHLAVVSKNPYSWAQARTPLHCVPLVVRSCEPEESGMRGCRGRGHPGVSHPRIPMSTLSPHSIPEILQDWLPLERVVVAAAPRARFCPSLSLPDT